MSTLNERGAEVFDQTPIEYPIHFDRPIPLHIRIRQQILAMQEEMRMQSEYDTPDEADDFSVDGDDDDWSSPYEVDFDHISDSPEAQNLENQKNRSEMIGALSSEDSTYSPKRDASAAASVQGETSQSSRGGAQPPQAEKQQPDNE